ncbi:MAG: hypothetical protein M1497_15990 [Nitrospirae bacterium]|nr:hypothetical protein [Nitrospirota bacterium]
MVNPWPSPPATSLQTPAENYQTKVGATRFAGEEGVPGTNAPVVFRNADLQNGPWKPTETGRGLDTGGMDIEDIMARYAPPPAATPGTGLSIPSGGGYFGSLLSLATAIGNARAGRANEYQRWHRGIDMAKLAFDALNKSREAGIKAPYYATAGEHNLASADLARRQGLALEVKPEAQMRKDYIDTAQKVYSSLLSNGNMEPAQALEMAYQFADESMRRFSALGSPPSAKTTAKTAPMSYTKYRELANGHGITDEAKIEAGYKEDFGVEPYIPSARARQDIAGQESKSPYPEGTKLNGPGGKQYVVKNGVPIPTGEAMSSSPTVPVEQGRKLDSAKPEDQAIAAAILKEAGGDKNKAGEIARQRGYRF